MGTVWHHSSSINNNCVTIVQSDRFCQADNNPQVSLLLRHKQTPTGADRMSLTMTKTDGVTVLTLTSDPESSCPPLCQILKGLCYSPACCSVSQHLRRVQGSSQSVLGALHIMVGLLNIALGAILCSSGGGSWWQMEEYGFPFWLGGIFIMFGVLGILSEKYPYPCLVIFNVILNLLAGNAFAIAAITLYSINITYTWFGWCDDYDYSYRRNYSPSPHEDMIREKCIEGRTMMLMLSGGINGLLIVLSVLELCLVISSAVMGIKALVKSERRENESNEDPEHYKPLLEGVTSNPTA